MKIYSKVYSKSVATSQSPSTTQDWINCHDYHDHHQNSYPYTGNSFIIIIVLSQQRHHYHHQNIVQNNPCFICATVIKLNTSFYHSTNTSIINKILQNTSKLSDHHHVLEAEIFYEGTNVCLKTILQVLSHFHNC